MNIGVLLALIVTGLTGMFLLATWLGARGHDGNASQSAGLPQALVFSHVSAAVIVFVAWIFFVVLHTTALAWGGAGVLVAVVTLGLALFRRWVLLRRAPAPTRTPEDEMSVVAVAIHGAFATVTAVLVVLALAQL